MSAVVVLGAGPAGLLAALEAAEAGHDVTVLEAQDAPGGMSASFTVAGQRVDLGSHRLHPATDPAHMRRIQHLLGADLQVRQRNGRIRLRGRWVGFPLRAVDMVRSLPPDFSARVAKDAALSPFRSNDTDSFAAEIVRRLGPTIFSEFYAPYAQKLYGVPPHELGRELADRRVAASSPWDIMAKVVRAARSDGRIFWYPKHGYGQIIDRLADAAIDAGVDLRMATPATHIETTRHGEVTVTTATDAVRAATVLSTIPQRALAAAISSTPSAVTDALQTLRTRSMVLVYLVVPQRQYTSFDAHYFPETEIHIARLSESKNYRDGDDPADHTVLCAEIACWPGDATWAATDAELRDRVVADLERAGLPVPIIDHVEVRRLPNVYPIFEPKTASARELGHEWVDGLDCVLSLGRQGLGVPDNIHHVFAMASSAVACLGPNGEIDRNQWQRHLGEFSTHVVQD